MYGLFAALAVMLSPRGLTLAGNGAGTSGVVFLGFLVLAAVLSVCTARSIAAAPFTTGALKRWYFPFALGLLDASRLFALVMLSVSWLGLAGYALNEIFAPWYPNLGASFTLLAIALGACFIPADNGKWLFSTALTIALLSLVYVTTMATQPADTGYWYPTVVPPLFTPLFPETLTASAAPWLQTGLLSLLAFIGFDLAVAPGKKATRALPAIIILLLTFGLFTWGALLLVAPERIAESFVPHLTVARKTFGNTGRVLMGLTIVLGTLAAVLGTFRILGQRLACLVKREHAPRWQQAVAVCMALSIGGLMGTGWAGEQALETFIAAGVCLWFIAYALFDLGAILVHRSNGTIAPLSVLAFCLHLFAAGMMAYHAEFIRHFLYAAGGIAASGMILLFLHKRLSYTYEPADNGQPDQAVSENPLYTNTPFPADDLTTVTNDSEKTEATAKRPSRFRSFGRSRG